MTHEEIIVKGQEIGWIYLIEAGNGGPIKVGWAKDPAKRMRRLQTGHSELMNLIAAMPGTRHLEGEIHRRLRLARLYGEWFERGRTLKLLRSVIAEHGLFLASKADDSRTIPETPKRGSVPKRVFLAV